MQAAMSEAGRVMYERRRAPAPGMARPEESGDPAMRLSARIFSAFLGLCDREHRALTHADLAARVGALTGRAPHATTVTRWFPRTEIREPEGEGGRREEVLVAGSPPKDLATLAAIADVCGVNRGWLAYGPAAAPRDAVTRPPTTSAGVELHPGLADRR